MFKTTDQMLLLLFLAGVVLAVLGMGVAPSNLVEFAIVWLSVARSGLLLVVSWLLMMFLLNRML